MTEPTFKQHNLLVEIEKQGYVYMTNKGDNIEMYWELVREGYLNNLVLLGSNYDWKFRLTDEAVDYLNSI